MTGKFLLFPYYLTLKVRDFLYKKGKRAIFSFDIPIISVGNVTVGGTGKTPAVEAIVRALRKECRVAVLSRGYGRKTKGFILVDAGDSAAKVGDEPLQIKRKFPDVTVAVDKVRERAVERLLEMPEESRPQVIVMDDGFQYRRLARTQDIVLVDYSRPVFKDNLLPLGRLRDLPSRISEAGTVLITKCPLIPDGKEREEVCKANRLNSSQKIFFSRIKYLHPVPVFEDRANNRYIYSKEIFLFSGIADDTSLILHLTEIYDRIYHRRFGDHHYFSKLDILKLNGFARSHPRTMLLTTEKDAQRLRSAAGLSDSVRERLFYIPIEMEFFSPEERNEFSSLLKSFIPSVKKRRSDAKSNSSCSFTGKLF